MTYESIPLIVCRDPRHAARVSGPINSRPRLNVCWPSLAQLRGFAPRTIIVMPGVKLDQDIEGEGSLRALLKSLQVTWGDAADFIEL